MAMKQKIVSAISVFLSLFAFMQTSFGQSEITPVKVGQTVTFFVTADGYPVPTLQWYKNGTAIVGATGSMLVLSKVALTDAGTYTVIATNTVGSAVSNNEVLSVVVPKPKAADDSYEVIDPSPIAFWKALRKDFALASLPKTQGGQI